RFRNLPRRPNVDDELAFDRVHSRQTGDRMDGLRALALRLVWGSALVFTVASCSSQTSTPPPPPEPAPETVGRNAQAVVSNLTLFPTSVDATNTPLVLG